MIFEVFLIKFISKMNHNSSAGEMSIMEFDSIYVNGNWAHLREKNSRPGAEITKTFRPS